MRRRFDSRTLKSWGKAENSPLNSVERLGKVGQPIHLTANNYFTPSLTDRGRGLGRQRSSASPVATPAGFQRAPATTYLRDSNALALPRSCATDGDECCRGRNQSREIRPDRVGDIARSEMRIVTLRHPRVGMSELSRDDGHRHPAHGEDRGMG